MNKEQMLMEYIKQELLHGKSPDLTSKDNLLDTGIIDSLGILRLVSFIEDRMAIEMPPEDVVYENFSSVDALVEYLNSLET